MQLSTSEKTKCIHVDHCTTQSMLVFHGSSMFTVPALLLDVALLNVLLQKSSCFQLLLLRHWHFTRYSSVFLKMSRRRHELWG